MGAGSNQLTIGPNPNSRLNFISGISRYLAHILCIFLFLSLEGDPARWTPLAEGTLFLGVFTKGESTGNFGFKFMQPLYPGGGTHCFSLPAKLDCIELASPSFRRKVETKGRSKCLSKVKSGKSQIAHRNAKIVECSSLIYFFLLPFLSAPRSEKREVAAENPPPPQSC
jgi:hypothetical protein